MIEELKQRIIAKSGKIRRFEKRIDQFRIDRMFNNDQKKVYKELNGEKIRTNDIPNADESKRFWAKIRTIEKEHNKDAEWLSELKKEFNGKYEQRRVSVTAEKVNKQTRKTPNWKSPGKDGVQGYWIKNITSLHERIAQQIDDILSGTEELPEWLTHGKTVLCQKDLEKGNAVDNYRPITCLPLLWKLLTGIIAEDMYEYLEEERILPEEQKGVAERINF